MYHVSYVSVYANTSLYVNPATRMKIIIIIIILNKVWVSLLQHKQCFEIRNKIVEIENTKKQNVENFQKTHWIGKMLMKNKSLCVIQ